MNRTILAGVDKDRLYQAAEILLEARRTLEPIDDLPLALRPKTLEEAYYVQDLMLQAVGETGGWKVGAPAPDAVPLFAPMPRAASPAAGAGLRSNFAEYAASKPRLPFWWEKTCLRAPRRTRGTNYWGPSPVVIRRSSCWSRLCSTRMLPTG